MSGLRQSNGFRAEESVFDRLLRGLISGLTSADAGRLIVDSCVDPGYAGSASLVYQISPSVLRLHTVRAVSADNAIRLLSEPSESMLEESWSVLLDDESLQEVVPVAAAGAVRTVHRWPELLAALVVDFESSVASAAAGRFIHEVLPEISRRLLLNVTDHSILFPEPDRLDSLAEFAAGAGHEINNPLASILGQTQILLRQESSMENRQALETIGSQAWRIRDMIGDVMLFARPPAPDLLPQNLVEIIRRTVETSAANLLPENITLDFRCGVSDLTVAVDKAQFATMLSHLIRNAVDAIRGTNRAGEITVMLRTDRRGRVAEIVVRDTGPGIHDSDVRQHLFDPFYSGRQAGRGLGFGLSLCRQIVVAHHGMILYHNPSPGISEFHVGIPLQYFDG